MEQDIRFCELGGQRIAYATVGEGPLLLFGGRWVTHLEEEWANSARARVLRRACASTPRRSLRPDRSGALGSRPCRAADARVRARDPGCGACRLRRRAGDDLRLLLRGSRDRRRMQARSRSAYARSSSSAATSRAPTSPKRRAARSSTSCARTGRSPPRCWRGSSSLTAAETRSRPRAAISAARPTRRSPPRFSISI